ncbi:Stonustoxin subunit alpha [Anabarilius grahami]|uniref:Stonustoxin subunit alpha n=1 Tax=Anabarilius grahami TaxID=495550 RepID=A0A3N0XM96_ANAGA|nr:Stonustoxin subunit alpha [Anabarilius grahami]
MPISTRGSEGLSAVTLTCSLLRRMRYGDSVLRQGWSRLSLSYDRPDKDFVPKTRNGFLQYSRRLTPDLNTVFKGLLLSENNTLITKIGRGRQSYPDHPDRFDWYRQVLCRESVSDRRSYWEVEWSGNYVLIAVSYKSICRRGVDNKCDFGGNDQSWSLSSSYSFRHNNIETKLPVKSISRRVGVYVDHSAGILSFYSVSGDTVSLIHTVQTTFTQPLYPGISVQFPGSVKLC